ncbi:hypothetical protein [Hymenobacter psoromatis]|uniref:hypothetical protein n=1 Tax=Hymenobacter psoromatis TaxID=1484116 RepID=UPI001CBFAFE2|nr:hypothetical protein [Hymenobacter psoromatis]
MVDTVLIPVNRQPEKDMIRVTRDTVHLGLNIAGADVRGLGYLGSQPAQPDQQQGQQPSGAPAILGKR